MPKNNVDYLDLTVHQFSTVLNLVSCVVLVISKTPPFTVLTYSAGYSGDAGEEDDGCDQPADHAVPLPCRYQSLLYGTLRRGLQPHRVCELQPSLVPVALPHLETASD